MTITDAKYLFERKYERYDDISFQELEQAWLVIREVL